MGFSGVDAIVLVVYLAGVTAFGVRYGRQQRSIDAYFVGSRRIPQLSSIRAGTIS